MKKGLVRGGDALVRCWWAAGAEDYCAYHDREWGFPVNDDARLFEKICLEGFQSGLSWLTILRKRENFRRAFKHFDYRAVARLNRRSVDRILLDAGIVRHRGKIESTINNAKRALELEAEFGSLAAYFWSHEPKASARPRKVDHAVLMTMSATEESVVLSKDLRRRGWTYVGPTTAYAFMQAMGLVNDHLEGCCVRDQAARARMSFKP